LPVVKLLYSSIKDLLFAFAGEKKSFDKPVIVEMTSGGPKVVGFITREDLSILSLSEHVAVYLPQSYNFAGQVLIFPSSRVRPPEYRKFQGHGLYRFRRGFRERNKEVAITTDNLYPWVNSQLAVLKQTGCIAIVFYGRRGGNITLCRR